MKKLILLAVVLTCGVSNAGLNAEEMPIPTSPADRVIDLFEQSMTANDWDLAEIIALGAQQKFGSENVIAKTMLSSVQRAKNRKPELADQFEFPPYLLTEPARAQVYQITYNVDDLLPADNIQAGYNVIGLKLQKTIDVKDKMFDHCEIQPFKSNLSIVARATLKQHKQIQAALAELRQEKQQAAANP